MKDSSQGKSAANKAAGKKDKANKAMYGISRIDDEVHRTFAWRVSLSRRGKRYVKNFPDKKYGGKRLALNMAKAHRDALIKKYPPISRKEFCAVKRCNNQSGITGVYTYAKPYTLSDGTIKESWYWEANWPNDEGESVSVNFAVNRYGESLARQMAIQARKRGMQQVEGAFWASARGVIEESVNPGQSPNADQAQEVA